MPSTAPPPASAAAAKKPSKMKGLFASSSQKKNGPSAPVVVPSSGPELDDSLDLSFAERFIVRGEGASIDHSEKGEEFMTDYQRRPSTASSMTKSSGEQGGGSGGAGIKMDRYGFLIDDSKPVEKINLVQLRSDAKKWQSILDKTASSKKSNSVDIAYSTTPSKMKYYTRRGLPDAMRQKAWTSLTGVDLIIKAHPGKYEELVNRANAGRQMSHNNESVDGSTLGSKAGTGTKGSVLETIDRDLHRTFPKHYLFLSGNEDKDDGHGSAETESLGDVENIFDELELDDEVNTKGSTGGKSQSQKSLLVGMEQGQGQGQGSLRRVLRAYSMYDTDVGYCQGMNFIAAMFLTFLSEEESFWLLVVVMNEEPYKLREMFGVDMAGTHEVLYIAEKLLAQFLPKLARQMKEESLDVSMFVTPWLITVYTSTFPFDLVVRVWDSFLVEGWKVVYRVMLSLLDHASKDIAELPFEQILDYFRDFPSTVDGQTIMANSFRIPLKSKHIQNHVTQWRRQGGHKEQTDEGIVSTFKYKNSGGAKNSGGGTKDGMVSTLKRKNSGGAKSSGGASVSSNTSNSLSEPFKLSMRKAEPREIEIENLSEKLLPVLGSSKFAVMLHNVLSPEECLELIGRAETEGVEEDAIISNDHDCTRYLLDDDELAEVWYERIINALKDTPLETKLKNAPWIQKNSGMIPHAVGLNEHFRLLKYKQGQFFQTHTDTPFVDVGEMSCVSVQVYLNQNFKGGCTTFRSEGRYLDVKPRTGSILLFEHDILHEGQAVIQGKKYILRTDVMYSTNSSSNTGGVVSGTTPTEQL